MTLSAVLDTNVLVSGILWRGIPFQLLKWSEKNNLIIYTGLDIMAEVYRVLHHPKFQQYIENQHASPEELFTKIASLCTIIQITGIVGFGLLSLFKMISGGEKSFAFLSIGISPSCLGFLPFNMPNAKVFMGDVGSILLGFVFAAMVVVLSKSIFDFVCLASFFFPFYADELTTMVVRIKDSENLLQPHRRHLYQFLANEMWIPHWKMSADFGMVQFAVGVNILFKGISRIAVISLLTIYFGAFVGVGFTVRKRVEQRSF